MNALDITFFIGILLLVPSVFFVLELVAGLKVARPRLGDETGLSCVIIVPAHNEEAVLGQTLENLKQQAGPNDRVLVVAHNCTDRTAEIAAQWGCKVVERNDPQERGKGYALAYAVASLGDDSPDIAVVVDADCILTGGTLAKLKAACARTAGPVQAAYLMYAKADCPPQRRVSEFAIYLKNHVRLLGLARLGGSVPITGSGFAVPFSLLQDAALATGDIVEDMRLGVELALGGNRVAYIPDARILSPLPNVEVTAELQRVRWEHGHLGVIAQWLPRLVKGACLKRKWFLWMTALDLSILPLTLLIFCNLMLLVTSVGFALLTGDIRLAVVTSVVLSLMAGTLLMVNSASEKSYLRWSDLTWVLRFVLSKLVVYRSLATGKRSLWEKSVRD